MSDLYEVETILLSRPASSKARGKKGVSVNKLSLNDKEYFVKWKGYSIVESTWEPYENLKNVKQMVQSFCEHDEKKLCTRDNYKKMIKSPEFACEELTDKRVSGDRVEYLVRWKDFEQETWEDAANLPEEAIMVYNASKKEGEEHPKLSEEEMEENSNGTIGKRKITSKEVSRKRPRHTGFTEEQEVEAETLQKREDWKVSRVCRDHDNTLFVKCNCPDEPEFCKFSLEVFREIYPQKLIDFFVASLKFGGNKQASQDQDPSST
jgi:hypothetical protein